jgi:hypothetical protein
VEIGSTGDLVLTERAWLELTGTVEDKSDSTGPLREQAFVHAEEEKDAVQTSGSVDGVLIVIQDGRYVRRETQRPSGSMDRDFDSQRRGLCKFCEKHSATLLSNKKVTVVLGSLRKDYSVPRCKVCLRVHRVSFAVKVGSAIICGMLSIGTLIMFFSAVGNPVPSKYDSLFMLLILLSCVGWGVGLLFGFLLEYVLCLRARTKTERSFSEFEPTRELLRIGWTVKHLSPPAASPQEH